MHLLAESRGAIEVGNAVVSTNLPALIGLIAGKRMAGPIEALFFNPDNVDDSVIRLLNAEGTDDISPGQLAQLIDMVAGGTFRSADGGTDYTAELGQVRTPTLFCVGTVDNLATVGAVQRLHNRWGAAPADKDFALFGAINGHTHDYGHDDLVIGPDARREVYPVIRRWLDRRSGRKGPLEKLLPTSLPAILPSPAGR